MKTARNSLALVAAAGLAWMVHAAADSTEVLEERLTRVRNLAKAYYENPNTKKEAVEEFEKALALKPDSPRERLNYGLALIRAGEVDAGIAELRKVQEQSPEIPHTWFNLGIEYKKLGQFDEAIRQFEQMARLIPAEATTHYNLGVLYKRAGRNGEAIEKFQLAARLDPSLAAPHFQLFNSYRTAGERAKAEAELEVFKKIKDIQKDAVVGEDMNWSFYSEVYETIDPRPAADPAAELVLRASALDGKTDGSTAAVLTLDAAGDGKPGALVWSRSGALLYGADGRLRTPSGLEGLKDVTAAAAADYDNDGLVDLAVTTAAGALLFKNAGGVFARQNARLPALRFSKAVWLDFDHDNDLDLFLLGSPPALMRNEGAQGFAEKTDLFPFAAGEVADAVALRVVPDTKMTDLAVSYTGRPGTLYRDRLAGKYEAQPLAALPAGAQGLTVADANNDGWFDLAYAAAGRTGLLWNRHGSFEPGPDFSGGWPVFADLENRGVEDLLAGGMVFRNQGEGKFAPAANAKGLTAFRAAAAADFNGDGRVDLLAVGADGSLRLLSNEIKTGNRWIRVALTGKKAPKAAPASEVELKAGLLYQKKAYHGLPVLFGTGSAKEIDTVRITWSNGLIQNTMREKTLVAVNYVEEERLSGSCPMIWTWDGRGFRFITDVLGVSPLGVQIGEGKFFPADHDEYVLLPPGSLVESDGKLEIRVTQELAEVAYLDAVKLLAVDHPDSIEVFTNEKFSVPAPDFRLWGVRERVYPRAARDHAGRDVLPRLAKRDGEYVDKLPRAARRGVAGMHALDLDFGQAAPANDAALVLSGWVDWADGSTYLGHSQEDPRGLVMPYVQVKDARGQWVTAVENMGVPAGLPKTVVIDLAGRFLSPSREVRIVTNMCVYWDEIFLAEGAAAPRATTTVLTASADVRFRGFARIEVDPAGVRPQRFFYDHPVPYAPWTQTPGLYTRYGDVTELLADVDDRFVVIGPGDEVRLRFNARALPPLPAGSKRTYVLGVDGWEKDQDPNTITSRTVEPLPFHAMSQYPYPAGETYPDAERRRRYIEEYQTRPALRLIRPLARR